jgi:hypothetical protein
MTTECGDGIGCCGKGCWRAASEGVPYNGDSDCYSADVVKVVIVRTWGPAVLEAYRKRCRGLGIGRFGMTL